MSPNSFTTIGPIPVPRAQAAWGAAPLLDPHGLAVVGGGVPVDDRVPLLAMVDLDGGNYRLVEWTPPEGTDLVEVGTPRRVSDATCLVPVYAHDRSLHVLRVDPDGSILTDDQLGGGWPPDPDEGPTSMWLAVVPVGRDHYLVSWAHRGQPEATTALYGPRSDRPVWSHSGRLVQRAARFAITVTVGDAPRIAAHDALTGKARWSVDARYRLVAGANRRLLVVVELTGHATAEAAKLRLEREFLRGGLDEATVAARLTEIDRQRAAPESTRVLAFSMESGDMVWSTHVEGQVLDAQVGREDTWVWSAHADQCRLRRFARTGLQTLDVDLPPSVPVRASGGSPDHRIVGVREDDLVVAGPGDLRLVDASGQVIAKTLLPAPCVGEHAVHDERLLPLMNARVRNDRVALRDADRLWVMTLPRG